MVSATNQVGVRTTDETSDVELCKLVRERACSESLKTLISRHAGICYRVYRAYLQTFIRKGIAVDFQLEKDFIIYSAALTYQPELSKFSSWVYDNARYFCLNQLKANANSDKIVHLDLPEIAERVYFSYERNEEIKDFVLDILGRLKDPRILKIYKMRYFNERLESVSWREIAADVNMSVQGTINLHDSVIRLLKEKLTNSQMLDII